jgi:hypothetical protein
VCGVEVDKGSSSKNMRTRTRKLSISLSSRTLNSRDSSFHPGELMSAPFCARDTSAAAARTSRPLGLLFSSSRWFDRQHNYDA